MRDRYGARVAVGAAALLLGVLLGTTSDRLLPTLRDKAPPTQPEQRGNSISESGSRASLRISEAKETTASAEGRVALAATPIARRPREWGGMPAGNTDQVCPSADRCGLALGCRRGRCGACGTDADCAVGEVCVLEHCVRARFTECKSRDDCPAEQLCILSGVSPGPRGNEEMRAYCLPHSGSSGEVPVPPNPPGPQILPEIFPGRLLSTLRSEP